MGRRGVAVFITAYGAKGRWLETALRHNFLSLFLDLEQTQVKKVAELQSMLAMREERREKRRQERRRRSEIRKRNEIWAKRKDKKVQRRRET